jgi:hypothetical protein
MDQWPSTWATVTRPVAAATELIAARRQKTATTRPPSARLGMPASLVSASRFQRRSNAPVSGRSQSPPPHPRSAGAAIPLPLVAFGTADDIAPASRIDAGATWSAAIVHLHCRPRVLRNRWQRQDSNPRRHQLGWSPSAPIVPPRSRSRRCQDALSTISYQLSAISYRLTADGFCQLTTSGVRLVLPTRPLASPRTGPGDSRPGRAAPGDGDRPVPTCETRRAGDS